MTAHRSVIIQNRDSAAEYSVCSLVRGVKIGDKRCRGISVVCGVRIHLRNQLSESEWASSLRQAVCYRGKSPEFLLSGSCTGSLPMRLSWSPSINLHVSWGNTTRITATHWVLHNHSQLQCTVWKLCGSTGRLAKTFRICCFLKYISEHQSFFLQILCWDERTFGVRTLRSGFACFLSRNIHCSTLTEINSLR